MYRRLLLKERDALLDRHVQHVVDRLAAQRDLQRLAVETRALADAARDLDVGHEIELRGDDTLALTLFAATALDVEAESSWLVAAVDRERRLREEVADRVVEAHVGRRIRAAVAADRRLIDVDHLVDVLETIHAVMLAREGACVHEPLPQRFEEDLVDERTLARP